MPNLLASEPSAYLKSAAHQPVHWHPWGEPAFARARAEDKPILLDIGAVWCHWCHVMDGESYEDPSVAETLNRDFVCIKVEGDERRGRAGDPGARRERDGAPVRHPLRRIRHRAQVSPSGGRATPARALARHARELDARGGGEDPHRDGERRDPRPRGWRIPPLCGGRALDRPPPREDGLRQLGAVARVPGWLRGARTPAVQGSGPGHRELGPGGAVGPGQGRFLYVAGRGRAVRRRW